MSRFQMLSDCGLLGSLAVFCGRFVSLVSDDEDAGCGFDDVVEAAQSTLVIGVT